MKTISAADFKKVLEAEKNDEDMDFVDVCESSEYHAKHIEGTRNVPLSEIEGFIEGFHGKKKVYINCASGHRSKQAVERLKEAGVEGELTVVEGGVEAWEEAGYPTKSTDK